MGGLWRWVKGGLADLPFSQQLHHMEWTEAGHHIDEEAERFNFGWYPRQTVNKLAWYSLLFKGNIHSFFTMEM